jgi:isoaspartyl peptidase/L-asparaginase-like protein (Ntn-hydrolase superfamily)
MAKDPVVIATWQFGVAACEAAWAILSGGGSALDAIEAGANVTEEDPEVQSVGYGGLPNADGVVELDAAIMDGPTHGAGAVAGLTGIRKPISVARKVMELTPHSMLVGGNARRFALKMGFEDADLLTDGSRARWQQWREAHGAPEVAHFGSAAMELGLDDGHADGTHDTIGLCALDVAGDLAAGCTTSGLAWKIPGRVGDSPIIGSGLYVDNEVGAAAATGNGDEIMKVCLSYRVVTLMEQGMSPQAACEEAIRYLLRKRPGHQSHGAACIAVSREGITGAAATAEGFDAHKRQWQYAVGSSQGVTLCEGSYVSFGE